MSFQMLPCLSSLFFFFFNDPATTEIYTLSLHDALPILGAGRARIVGDDVSALGAAGVDPRLHIVVVVDGTARVRSEEHTSELQSHVNLVCRLLLEKKKLQDLTPAISILA